MGSAIAFVNAASVNHVTATLDCPEETVEFNVVRLKTAVVPLGNVEHKVALAGSALGVTIGIYWPGGNE